MSGRIRTLKPEILDDERTAELSDAAFRLFVGMIVLADDYGALRAGARQLCGKVFWGSPDDHDDNSTTAALGELVASGLVTAYEVRGQMYAALNGWAKHQRIDNAGKARVPAPTSEDARKLQPEEFAEFRRESPRTPKAEHEPRREVCVLNRKVAAETSESDPDLRSRPPNPIPTPTGEHEGAGSAAAPLPPQNAADGDFALTAPQVRDEKPDAAEVVAHYKRHHPHARPGEKEKKLIRARLKEGYSVADLCRAIDGNHQSPFHCGENERGTEYHELGLIMRDSDHVAMFIRHATGPPRSVLSERTRRNLSAAQNFLESSHAGEPEVICRVDDSAGGDIRDSGQ